MHGIHTQTPEAAQGAPSLTTAPRRFSQALVSVLARLGVKQAFGLMGGAVAPFSRAVAESEIELLHFRHESGASFAAIEASLASDRPVVVFSTTGPGITNNFTGMVAARTEGARIIYVSGVTGAAQAGRQAFQETSTYRPSLDKLFASDDVFHFGRLVQDAAELPVIATRLAQGMARLDGFVAHLGLPLNLQMGPCTPLNALPEMRVARLPEAATVQACARILQEETTVLWVGFGARHAASAIRELAAKTGMKVMASPRAKGIFPETHPHYLGVTGLGGHPDVLRQLKKLAPSRLLVLGSRLSEFTSFWLPTLVADRGIIQVDIDPTVLGTAYPGHATMAIQADVGAFVRALLPLIPPRATTRERHAFVRRETLQPRTEGPVRPAYLMQAMQTIFVQNSDAILLTEAGNSFALGSHHWRFGEPGRYRVSTQLGAMGHASAGVLGATLACGKAAALVGDGALLMQNEINTAVAYKIPAVWVVLNDARYGMIEEGMRTLAWEPFATEIPRCDFVRVAEGMGAKGVRVEHEVDLVPALEAARAAIGPFVVDVTMDRSEPTPAGSRTKSLQEAMDA